MKATLDASIKEHREIGLILGAMVCLDNKYFVEWIDGLEYRASCKITIDLDQAQMDLRMAIGTGIRFLNIKKYNLGTVTRYYDGKFALSNNNWWHDVTEVKLCPDYLKSVGVEVEE